MVHFCVILPTLCIFPPFSDLAVYHVYTDFHAVFDNYLPSMEFVSNICTGGKTWIQQAGLFNMCCLKLSVLHYLIFISFFFKLGKDNMKRYVNTCIIINLRQQ